jgi:hypothetical protein
LRKRVSLFAKYWLAPLAVNVVAFGWALAFYYDVPILSAAGNNLRCAFASSVQDAVWRHEKLISQSGFSQTLALAANTADEPAEVEGWNVFKPNDFNQPAVIRLTLEGPQGEAVFFPRLSGGDAFISVAAVENGRTKTVFLLNGAPDVWTPIGAQFPLDLRCLRENDRVELIITLQGRWTQLWNKDSVIFF